MQREKHDAQPRGTMEVGGGSLRVALEVHRRMTLDVRVD
jgi:hypothetical protein